MNKTADCIAWVILVFGLCFAGICVGRLAWLLFGWKVIPFLLFVWAITHLTASRSGNDMGPM